jgi:multidrug efflux pump subunit AcrB
MKFIRLFVNNPVAANMLMIIILGGGLVAAMMIPRELFPEFELNVVTVAVPYPGATPSDVEKGITVRVEEYVEEIDGVKEMTSISQEGLATISLELYENVNVNEVLDEVKSEVDKIDFNNDRIEDPIVRDVTLKRHVIQVAVYGDAGERTLKEIAEDMREELLDKDEISEVSISGVREYEISVEIDEQAIRRFGLTPADIAGRIQSESFDLPAGRLKTEGGEYTLRIIGQRYTAQEYETIPVAWQDDGTVVYLRDIATVREAFADTDIRARFNGRRAALIGVYKVGDEDVIEISRVVRQYIDQRRQDLPAGVQLATWSDRSELVEDRLDMLVGNGLWGLLLVVAVLWLFLGLRLSFWVALGIPISILGTIMVMDLAGQSLNMMSMFALIMALGLIVDDAIVVGENVYTRYQKGEPPKLAAVRGTHQVIFPVTGAVITTWLAFIPLLLIPGVMGKFIRQLPGVVILTLAFSLIECLAILPSHLAHSLQHRGKGEGENDEDSAAETPERSWAQQQSDRIRARIDAAIDWFIHGAFAKFYRLAVRFRYVTVAIFIGVMILMAGAYRGGFVKVTIFPKVESDTLRASVTLPAGTPVERTEAVVSQITQAARDLCRQCETESGEPIVENVYAEIGSQSGGQGGGESGGHVAQVIVELLPVERRGQSWSSMKLTNLWREQTGRVPDAQSLQFGAFRGGPGGTSLEIRALAETTEQAKRIAGRIEQRLEAFEGVTDIRDDALPGKIEKRIRRKREALSLGVTKDMIANQLRDAFYGNESLEIQRGRDEVKVMVRFPESGRENLGDLENKRIITPDGSEVPLMELAEIDTEQGYTTLRRAGRKSVVTVSADVNEDDANSEQILGELQREGFFQSAVADVPGASIDLRGQRQQRTESLGALFVWFPIALLGIYTVLATIFRSYTQPVIVMLAIPFGLIGAVIGHWIMGFDVTLLSMFGMVALAGIVVNDSLVLIDRVNENVREGMDVHQAAEMGARSRFRAILLTTVTTVVGMAPLLAEQSFQAQFLKPMAVAISFGLMFATTLTLLAVPCLYLIGNDLRRFFCWAWRGYWPSPEYVLTGSLKTPSSDEADETPEPPRNNPAVFEDTSES